MPNKFEEELLWTVDGRAASPRLLPEDDLPKDGCGGRPGASDIRDEDMERPWFVVCGAWLSFMFDMEFDRFNAEAGCGIAELKLRPPSVCDYIFSYSSLVYEKELTSRGRRTLKRPVSCDIDSFFCSFFSSLGFPSLSLFSDEFSPTIH